MPLSSARCLTCGQVWPCPLCLVSAPGSSALCRCGLLCFAVLALLLLPPPLLPPPPLLLLLPPPPLLLLLLLLAVRWPPLAMLRLLLLLAAAGRCWPFAGRRWRCCGCCEGCMPRVWLSNE